MRSLAGLPARQVAPHVRQAASRLTLLAVILTLAAATAAGQTGAGDLVSAELLTAHGSSGLLETSPSVGVLEEALRALALTRDDLSFRTDYADQPDSFRIARNVHFENRESEDRPGAADMTSLTEFRHTISPLLARLAAWPVLRESAFLQRFDVAPEGQR